MSVDVFNIPLYYISFKSNRQVEDAYKKLGFTNVTHFPAVNGKKMKIDKLYDDGLLSIRGYDDLTTKRQHAKGFPSLGAIGCTLSHYELWQKCVRNDWPYIIIAEEDNVCNNISQKHIDIISKALSKKNGGIVSPSMTWKKNGLTYFFGTHFCILRNDTCKELIKRCFPLDVQTDWYIGHLNRVGKINIEYPEIAYQKFHLSSIQDSNTTSTKIIYASVAVVMLFILVLLISHYYRKYS